jgi:hypothetical protein
MDDEKKTDDDAPYLQNPNRSPHGLDDLIDTWSLDESHRADDESYCGLLSVSDSTAQLGHVNEDDETKRRRLSGRPTGSGGGGIESKETIVEANSNRRSHRVAFRDISDIENNNDDHLIASSSVPDQLAHRLTTMKSRIAQLRLDIAAEKLARKRKDRNIVKLAKELNRRGMEMEFKDSQIVKLAQTINDMERRIHLLLDEANAKALDEKKSFPLTQEITQNVDEKLSLDNVDLQSDTTQPIGNNFWSRPPTKEFDFPNVLEHSTLSFNSNGDLFTDAIKRSKRGHALRRLALVAIIFLTISLLYSMDWLSYDALCSPVLPGFELYGPNDDRQIFVLEAPWWAPRKIKAQAFQSVCRPNSNFTASSRFRVRIVWTGGKLSAYSMEDTLDWWLFQSSVLGYLLPSRFVSSRQYQAPSTTEAKLLWQKRASNARFGARSIHVLNKKGDVTESIEAPWTILP